MNQQSGGNMEPIDVILITKNAQQYSPLFQKSLDTLFKEVPVSRLLVVDAFSTDKTLEVLQQYPKVEVHQIQGNRALARQYGIEHIETSWFLFLDDDVILCPNWWKTALKYMQEPQIGLIWGWSRTINPHTRNRMKIMYYLRRKSEYALQLRVFQHRGGTHDTLIRRLAIQDIQIPRDLHIFEDWYIKQFVEAKGFHTIAPNDLWCYHWLNPNFTYTAIAEIARLAKKYKLETTFQTIFKFILSLPKALAILLVTGDFKAAADQFKFYTYNFLGRIH